MVVALACAFGAVNATVTDAQRAAFTAAIARADAALSASAASVDAVLNATNPADDAASCVRRSPACGPEARALGADYVIDFSRAVQSDYDFAQSKAQAEPPAAGSREAATLCRLERMRDAWRAQLTAATGRRGDVLFQYYADAASQGFAVYPPLRWDCAAGYVPARRPWYVAGAAGQKDLVIAVDVSDDTAGSTADPAARVAAARAAAAALLDSLSFRDYVALVPYTTFADLSVTPELVQATAATVALLQERVRRLAVVAGSRSRVAAAVEGALGVLDASAAAGATSRCSRMVALLSGGVDTAPGVAATDPAVTLARRGDTVVVAVQTLDRAASSVSGDATVPLNLRRLACASRGLAMSADVGQAADTALRLNAYLAGTTNTQSSASSARWSEVYHDAFTQDLVVSGTRALYNETTGELRGVLAMDVSLDLFRTSGDGGVEVEFNVSAVNALVYGATDSACPLRNLNTADDAIAELQGSICDGVFYVHTPTANSESAAERDRNLLGLWVLIAVAVPCFMTALPFIILACPCKAPPSFKKFLRRGVPLTIAQLVCWLIFLSVFFACVFDDAIVHHYYEQVTFRTIRQDASPYDCCERRDCTCTEYGSYEATDQCAYQLGNLTPSVAGSCGGGYLCCHTEDYDCDCVSDRCGRCTRCTHYVVNQRCRVDCGMCYSPEVTLQYTHSNRLVEIRHTGACEMDDSGCVDRQWQAYPLGSAQTGWVDPLDVTDLRLELPLNRAAAIAAGVFGALYLVFWGCAMVHAIRRQSRKKWLRQQQADVVAEYGQRNNRKPTFVKSQQSPDDADAFSRFASIDIDGAENGPSGNHATQFRRRRPRRRDEDDDDGGGEAAAAATAGERPPSSSAPVQPSAAYDPNGFVPKPLGGAAAPRHQHRQSFTPQRADDPAPVVGV